MSAADNTRSYLRLQFIRIINKSTAWRDSKGFVYVFYLIGKVLLRSPHPHPAPETAYAYIIKCHIFLTEMLSSPLLSVFLVL